MSSGVLMTQIPYLSFHRSSTPMPYSAGSPTLNCCGGSLRTLGNMKRPVAASAAADAAENAPHASPIHARRVRSGDVSSGSRPVATAAAGLAADVVAALAAAPPGEATFVVFPARSGIGAAGGRGAGAGRACGVVVACGVAAGLAPVAGALAVCPAAGEPVGAVARVASLLGGTTFGAGVSGFVSSDI